MTLTPRLGPGLLVWLLACLLAAEPLSGCVEDPNKSSAGGGKAGIWIGIDEDDNVMIKVKGLMAFPAVAGQDCGCGIEKVPSLSIVSSAQVMNSRTGEPVSQFSFVPNSNAAQSLSQASGGGDWFGFAADLPAPVSQRIPVDLVFTGKLAPGTSFATLKAELLGAGNVIGFGKATPNGSLPDPQVCPPSIVDPLPQGQAAPVIQVSRMAMEDSFPSVELSAQDGEEGLATLRVLDAVNLSDSLPSFTPGTTAPVVVGFTLENGESLGSFGLEACNVRGECSEMRAHVAPLKIGLSGVASRTFADVPGTKSRIEVQNGRQGVRTFILSANGQRFSVRPLAAGQILTLDLPLALQEPQSSVRLAVRGEPESEALVLMVERP